jgi:glyoxylase-like metal-dependent hydrolase (beta-lactamase superfamily II)
MRRGPEPVAHGLAQFAHGIYAVDTLYVRPRLDASHLIVHGGRAAFVDTGPASAVPLLLSALRRLDLDVGQVDYVLLTHVHLDHAGGAGELMRALPNARAVVHPRGARHLADPSKLVAGSIAVYGEENFRRLYGEIVPIPESRLSIAEDGQVVTLAGRELELIHTPGHALHHYCIVDRTARAVFTGDNFGLSYRDFDTHRGAFIFPTTTPVHFDPEAMHASLDRIMSYRPRAIYLTHFSEVTELERLARDLHECIDGFVDIARRNDGRPDRGARIRSEMFGYLSQRLDAHGYEGSEALRRELLWTDVELNSQGLEVWLDRQKSPAQKQPARKSQ